MDDPTSGVMLGCHPGASLGISEPFPGCLLLAGCCCDPGPGSCRAMLVTEHLHIVLAAWLRPLGFYFTLGAARRREQSQNQSRQQPRAALDALEPSAQEEPCAVTTGVTCPCHVPRVHLRLWAGTGKGVTGAKGWKGKQQSSFHGLSQGTTRQRPQRGV